MGTNIRYLSLLEPYDGKGAIQFFVLHLRGIAQDWWQHGLHNQGHKQIKSYDEFTQKLIKRFDRVDPEWYFKRLTQIKQEGSVSEFAREFKKLSAMVPELSQKRLTYLFIDGLKEPIKSAIGAHEPTNLEEAIQKALKFEPPTNNPKHSFRNDKSGKKRTLIPEWEKEELREKNLCFKCKEKWEYGHTCNKGKDQDRSKCFKCKDPWAPQNRCNQKDIIKKSLTIERLSKSRKIREGKIDEAIFEKYLSTHNLPDPELMIRTSGEHRISNYLLWQLAYAELYFTNKLWPDFRREDLFEAVYDYQQRERRFGLTSEQIG